MRGTERGTADRERGHVRRFGVSYDPAREARGQIMRETHVNDLR